MMGMDFVEEVEEREHVGDLPHTTAPLPGEKVDWAPIRAMLQERAAARKGMVLREVVDEADGTVQLVAEEVERTPAFRVTSKIAIDPTTLMRSPKGIYLKVAAMGWTLAVRQTTTHHEAALMMKDGKVQKDGSQRMQGDVKTPAKDATHLFMQAFDRERRLAFTASWLDGGFESAIVWDLLVGVPVENFFDYSRLKDGIRPIGDYNDGTDRIAHKLHFAAMTPFVEWLDDWVGIIAPEFFEKKPKTIRKTKEEKADERALKPLELGEWKE